MVILYEAQEHRSTGVWGIRGKGSSEKLKLLGWGDRKANRQTSGFIHAFAHDSIHGGTIFTEENKIEARFYFRNKIEARFYSVAHQTHLFGFGLIF